MRFEFDSKIGCYKTEIYFKGNYIHALCDAGATFTTIDLYSLSQLLSIEAEEIYNQAVSLLNRGMAYRNVNTASGKYNRIITILLRNIVIGTTTFKNFYAGLNIDNEAWKTQGKIVVGGGQKVQVTPNILIGLDIIRASKITGDKKEIRLGYFNIKEYNEFYIKYSNAAFNIFEAIQINGKASNTELNEQDVMAYFVNEWIKGNKIEI